MQLPMRIDQYELTDQDKARALEEQALGMVPPQHPALIKKAIPVRADRIASQKIQLIVRRLLAAAAGQRKGSRSSKARRTLVGLAAPQLGASLRIIVVDTRVSADRKRYGRLECFINPEIIWRSRETEEDREGCFSTGLVWGLVRRPVAIKMRALTLDGKQVERVLEGFTARIVQHEVDHLDGIRFPDRIRSDKKRHWVHAEELSLYTKNIKQWSRCVTKAQWKEYYSHSIVPGGLDVMS